MDRLIRHGQRPTASGLAQRLGVSKRQIYLDRKFLAEALDAPLAIHPQGGWIYTNSHWVLPTVYLAEGEILAFFLSVEIARHAGNEGLNDILSGAVEKIAQGLGEIVSVDLKTLANATSFGLSPAARVNSQTYLALHGAWSNRQKVKMRYYTASTGEEANRIVHPYHLFLARGECLLLAFDELRDEVRCFNIARVRRLELLNDRFLQRNDFDAQEKLRTMLWAEMGDQVHNIAIRFDEYQTRYISERQWHPTQTLEKLPDGGSVLRFIVSSLPEAARFVLGFGQHAEVLEPSELRQMVQSHVEAMGRIYQGNRQ